MRESSHVVIVGADTFRARAYVAAIERAGFGPVRGIFYGGQTLAEQPLDGEGARIGSLWLPDLGSSVYDIFNRNGWSYLRLDVQSINDPFCIAALKGSGAQLAIFAGRGGEIVSAEVLNQGVPVLHMHPGRLPRERGSTTSYYSILEGRPCSVSALLMSPEIDAGPVLLVKAYPHPPHEGVDIDVLYDCAIRADAMLDVLSHLAQSGALPEAMIADDEPDGLYFVIHPVLKHLALLSLRCVKSVEVQAQQHALLHPEEF